MRINKSLGRGSVLSLSRPKGVVMHKDPKETAYKALALLGWVWIGESKATKQLPLPVGFREERFHVKR